jgi:two-component system response regulator CpxR
MVKILVADDDIQICQLLKDILIEKGFEVIDAYNGLEAINLYNDVEIKPDVLVLDYRMPIKNGLEVSLEIRQQDPAIRIIMISGDATLNHHLLFNNNIIYRTKPVRISDLINTIIQKKHSPLLV